jgi:superfamily I DNA and/or RNA helicase
MVDTSDRPFDERRETARGDTGTRAERGYVNALEADLIVALVAGADRWYRDWAVIVPYRAQARRIAQALAAVGMDSRKVDDGVGTVDSFQGGERDLIVYGFTRSNDRGAVGFLTELRRLNVAVSRAKQQLVVVGDLATLTAATDPGFRSTALLMVENLRRDGDLRPSTEVEMLLRDLG